MAQMLHQPGAGKEVIIAHEQRQRAGAIIRIKAASHHGAGKTHADEVFRPQAASQVPVRPQLQHSGALAVACHHKRKPAVFPRALSQHIGQCELFKPQRYSGGGELDIIRVAVIQFRQILKSRVQPIGVGEAHVAHPVLGAFPGACEPNGNGEAAVRQGFYHGDSLARIVEKRFILEPPHLGDGI